METAMLAYFTHLNTCLEAQAVLPRYTLGTGNLAITDRRLLWSAWNIKMGGDAGRYDKRDPTSPLSLANITLNGLQADSHVLLSNPTLPIYTDPVTTYFTRMMQLETELQIRYRGAPTPDADQLTLLGPYGAIITSVCNFDTPYLVIVTGDGQWINAWHEMGDQPTPAGGNGVFRFGTKTRWPLTKYHLSAIRVGPGDAENPAFPPSGSITWVNLPASWSAVPDANIYLFRDDFMGGAIDTAKWDVVNGATGLCEIDPLFQWLHVQKSVGGWGTKGVVGKTATQRAAERTLEFDVLVRANSTVMVGWMDGAGTDYTNFAHGLLFETSSPLRRITIFENGVNRGDTGVGSIVADRIYRIRIVLQDDGSAQYLIQGAGFAQLGGLDFTDITPATSLSEDGVLEPGVFVSQGDMYASDVRIY